MQARKNDSSALNNVVNSLLKSSVGMKDGGIHERSLNSHISSLLQKEAKQRQRQYELMGFGKFLESSTSLKAGPLKTNKRFLNTILNETKRHNQFSLEEERSYRSKGSDRDPGDSDSENSGRYAKTLKSDSKLAKNEYSLNKTKSNQELSKSQKPITRGRGAGGTSRMDRYFSGRIDQTDESSDESVEKHQERSSRKKKKRSDHISDSSSTPSLKKKEKRSSKRSLNDNSHKYSNKGSDSDNTKNPKDKKRKSKHHKSGSDKKDHKKYGRS